MVNVSTSKMTETNQYCYLSSLRGADEGEYVETYFEVGWNPEIIAAIKQTGITTNNLKWGF